MKDTQRSLFTISNRTKKIDLKFQNRISNVETKLNNIRELFNAKRNICHTGMVVELRSKKVLAPLEVEKKRLEEKQSKSSAGRTP